MAISLTETAAKEVKRIMTDQAERMGMKVDDMHLRLGVKGGGCNGFDYLMDIADRKGDDDELFEVHGVKIICDPKSHLYLAGVTVDFKDELMGRGFVFQNPNASSTCRCGSSFGV